MLILSRISIIFLIMITINLPFRSQKPAGIITRGKTAKNRLRQVDHFLMIYDPMLLSTDNDAVFVDLGYGAEATTTLELSERFRRINPVLKVIGVEIDPERVRLAQPHQTDLISFRLGGFNIPLEPGESIRGIRAFNVLRQYEEAEVLGAWEKMTGNVMEGGLLMEGTSNPNGSLWVSNLLRMRSMGWDKEALVFYSNFKMGFDPTDYQAVLPKNFIHRMIAGERIFDFMQAWKDASKETISEKAWGDKRWFISSVFCLKEKGYNLLTQKKYLEKGYMVVKGL